MVGVHAVLPTHGGTRVGDRCPAGCPGSGEEQGKHVGPRFSHSAGLRLAGGRSQPWQTNRRHRPAQRAPNASWSAARQLIPGRSAVAALKRHCGGLSRLFVDGCLPPGSGWGSSGARAPGVAVGGGRGIRPRCGLRRTARSQRRRWDCVRWFDLPEPGGESPASAAVWRLLDRVSEGDRLAGDRA